jgi:hypothetical protein
MEANHFPNDDEIDQRFAATFDDPLVNKAARDEIMRSLDDAETW